MYRVRGSLPLWSRTMSVCLLCALNALAIAFLSRDGNPVLVWTSLATFPWGAATGTLRSPVISSSTSFVESWLLLREGVGNGSSAAFLTRRGLGPVAILIHQIDGTN